MPAVCQVSKAAPAPGLSECLPEAWLSWPGSSGEPAKHCDIASLQREDCTPCRFFIPSLTCSARLHSTELNQQTRHHQNHHPAHHSPRISKRGTC